MLLGDRAGDVERRRVALLDDHLTQPQPRFEALQREGVLQLLCGQRAVADQQFPERGPLAPEVANRFHPLRIGRWSSTVERRVLTARCALPRPQGGLRASPAGEVELR